MTKPSKTDLFLFIGPIYDPNKNKIVLKLYNLNNNQLEFFEDWTDYKPYLLTDLPISEAKKRFASNPLVQEILSVEKEDPLKLRIAKFAKIVVDKPTSVPEIRNTLQKHWESNIPFHHNWIYDHDIIPGMIYEKANGGLQPTKAQISEKASNIDADYFKTKYRTLFDQYFTRFSNPIPQLLITAIDIEVVTHDSRMPSAEDPDDPVNCIGMASSNGESYIWVVQKDNADFSSTKIPSTSLKVFFTEEDMLKNFFTTIVTHPLIVTFNGNAFDMPYLLERAKKLGLKPPISSSNRQAQFHFNNSLHFDMYEWYSNPAIKTYAFSSAYKLNDLNSVATALIKQGKIAHEEDFSKLSIADLAYYCLNDASITLKIATFNDQLAFKLIMTLSRITCTPMEDITANLVSTWLKNLFYNEHRKHNMLIPKQSDISAQKSSPKISEAITKDKKYKGALVINPVPGIHFNVAVLDFASLYPSIIATRNLSYETIMCKHEGCTETIPDTQYTICKERTGLFAGTIGFFRDIRVYWLKPAYKSAKSPEESAYFSAMEKSIKVLLNASYGVMGNEYFPFYCLSVADATTAVGRYAITATAKRCKEANIEVLYGDTDSVFVKAPTKAQIEQVIAWSAKELRMELEIDKQYKYCVLTTRKKNYFGLLTTNAIDIKGLLGKKRNTPVFIQNAFQEMVQVLQNVSEPVDFIKAKEKIRNIVNQCYRDLESNKYSPEDLAITVQLTKKLSEYTVAAAHTKAAKMLVNAGKEIKPGYIIRYVKTMDSQGIKPVELMTSDDKLDISSYKSFVDATFSQILEALNININELKEKVNLLNFFS